MNIYHYLNMGKFKEFLLQTSHNSDTKINVTQIIRVKDFIWIKYSFFCIQLYTALIFLREPDWLMLCVLILGTSVICYNAGFYAMGWLPIVHMLQLYIHAHHSGPNISEN